MGSFYTNLTLRSPEQARVRHFLNGRQSYVSNIESPYSIVLDQECDTQNTEAMTELGRALSLEFKCPVLALLIHDDDILVYFLCEHGNVIDEYNSFPGYFGDAVPDGDQPAGGDAKQLARAFNVLDSQSIEVVLRTPHGDDYLFETDRHRDLVRALGIPEIAIGVGFNYFSSGDLPPSVSANAYVPVFSPGC
jgi:hypothetical protein